MLYFQPKKSEEAPGCPVMGKDSSQTHKKKLVGRDGCEGAEEHVGKFVTPSEEKPQDGVEG